MVQDLSRSVPKVFRSPWNLIKYLIAYLIILSINKLSQYVCGIKCMYAETLGCMYADFGCKSMERLGAKYADVGRIYAETLGCKVCRRCVQVYGTVGCIVCGCWVHSMWLLGA